MSKMACTKGSGSAFTTSAKGRGSSDCASRRVALAPRPAPDPAPRKRDGICRCGRSEEAANSDLGGTRRCCIVSGLPRLLREAPPRDSRASGSLPHYRRQSVTRAFRRRPTESGFPATEIATQHNRRSERRHHCRSRPAESSIPRRLRRSPDRLRYGFHPRSAARLRHLIRRPQQPHCQCDRRRRRQVSGAGERLLSSSQVASIR
jgi:hypothetical protein